VESGQKAPMLLMVIENFTGVKIFCKKFRQFAEIRMDRLNYAVRGCGGRIGKPALRREGRLCSAADIRPPAQGREFAAPAWLPNARQRWRR
jgi:hypothetical protein